MSIIVNHSIGSASSRFVWEARRYITEMEILEQLRPEVSSGLVMLLK